MKRQSFDVVKGKTHDDIRQLLNRAVQILTMIEKTLTQMYRGGIFDHIGGGFSRYSTDKVFFVPHFEKMLYDNALLIIAYCRAYEQTKNELYKEVAVSTADYVIKEMTSHAGGFYSAQDADSEGVEGKYYLWDRQEVIQILGEEKGTEFCEFYDISLDGNFEGKNIANLLKNENFPGKFEVEKKKLYEYRKTRYHLHLDDYANVIFGLLSLYEVSSEEEYLTKAQIFTECVITQFYDKTEGGFFLNGKENESLIIQPKEIYDGAMPSGNSMMAYNLVQLAFYTEKELYIDYAKKQLQFMIRNAKVYPVGYAMSLLAILETQVTHYVCNDNCCRPVELELT